MVRSAGVDDVDDAANTDVEHQIWLRVEKLGAVDEGQVVHFLHPSRCLPDGRTVADIAGNEFNIGSDAGKAPRTTARIVVEDAHAVARLDQRLYQCSTDETAAAGDEDTAHARNSSLMPSRGMS